MLAGIAFVKFRWHQDFRPLPGSAFFGLLRQRPRRSLVARESSARPGRRLIRSVIDRDLPSDEFISREVDPILDKISAHGIQSLTERERKILEAARAKMAKR